MSYEEAIAHIKRHIEHHNQVEPIISRHSRIDEALNLAIEVLAEKAGCSEEYDDPYIEIVPISQDCTEELEYKLIPSDIKNRELIEYINRELQDRPEAQEFIMELFPWLRQIDYPTQIFIVQFIKRWKSIK